MYGPRENESQSNNPTITRVNATLITNHITHRADMNIDLDYIVNMHLPTQGCVCVCVLVCVCVYKTLPEESLKRHRHTHHNAA